MNIHHLELFYYVAKHKGVTAATRHMPYPIQQSSISSQIKRFETDLGGKELFIRKPFGLTPAGEKLYSAIAPFFASMEVIERELRGEADDFVRIGSSAMVLRDHLPALLGRVRKKIPALRFTLENRLANDVPESVHTRQIDIGIGPEVKRIPKGVKSELIAESGLVLVVPADAPWRKAGDVLKSGPKRPPLIALPAPDKGRVLFDEELSEREIQYPASIEVNALYLVAEYVKAGFGVGLSVQAGRTSAPSGTRFLPLRGFRSLRYAVYWCEPTSKAGRVMLEEIRSASKAMKVGSSEG